MRVLACDPLRRIVVAWQITTHGDAWVHGPDLSRACEFEVNFHEQPGGQTRVELEHHNIGRHGWVPPASTRASACPGGWPGILDNWVKTAATA
jgi:hypothetical protein